MSRDAQQTQFYKPRLEITWGKGLPSETPICHYQILIDIVAHKLYMVQHCCIILSSIVPFVAQLDYFFLILKCIVFCRQEASVFRTQTGPRRCNLV